MAGKYARGLETEAKILKHFALEKEVYQYNIAEKIGISYRTVLRALHSCEETGKVEIVRKEESEKRGKKRNVWQITIKGLLGLLYLDKEAWMQLALIAEVHQDKLLIFKKWGFFEKEGLTEAITNGLKRTLQSVERAQLSLMHYHSARMEWTEEQLQKLVDSMSLGCYALRDLKQFKESIFFNNEVLKVLKACKKDEELERFVTAELNFFIKVAEDDLSWLEKAEDLFLSL